MSIGTGKSQLDGAFTPSPSGITIVSPGYFSPTTGGIFDGANGTVAANANPAANANITQWAQFFLPYNITIKRYRFQADAGTWTGGAFYAGLYDSTGALIFDIGKINLVDSASGGAGQYGAGALHDPGTAFFDASRNPQSSITLKSGWYYYGWGASIVTGTLTMPVFPISNLWNETQGVDTTGLGLVSKRWTHSNLVDIAGGHLPLVIRASGGAATMPINIVFFA